MLPARLKRIDRSAGARLGTVALMAMFLLLAGCEVNSFIDPTEPRIVSSAPKDGKPLQVPIVDSLDKSVEEPDFQVANATEVTPQDLEVIPGDYRIGKNDLVTVDIYELMQQGVDTVKTVRVTESGTITLPFIQPLKAEGLTEAELQATVIKAYQDANLLKSTEVSVTVAEYRSRTFSVLGNVGGAGDYQILQNDFRLLNAMVLAHGSLDSVGVDYIYIYRKLSSEPGAASTTQPSATPAPTTTTAPPSTQLFEPKGDAGGRGVILAADSGTGGVLAPGNDTIRTGTAGGQPIAIEPGATPASAPAAGAAAPSGPAAAPAGTAAAAPAAPASGGAANGSGFQFNTPSDEEIRVIRVPVKELRYGSLKYNVVIRPGDVVFFPDPVAGVYYMGGHVAHAGAYSLTGQQITLKQAVVAAGMFDQAAIPGRSEVIRRLKDNVEVFARVDLDRVWAGEQPDIYLKPNDTVMVGTNLLAPFIGAVRNSFRVSYGFGFLYDRNLYNGPNGF